MLSERWSRRRFVRAIGASAFAAFALRFGVGRGVTSRATSEEAHWQQVGWPRFDIDYDESVRVHLTNGRRFDLTLADLAGNVLEQHRHLDLGSLLRLRSDRFTVNLAETTAAPGDAPD